MATVKRVQAKRGKERNMVAATNLAPDNNKVNLCQGLSQAPEDAAITFFLSSYAPRGPLSFLSILAETPPSLFTELPTSPTLAPALAMLALELKQSSLMSLARKSYVTALNETNLALASPQLATKDATLASVLLLMLFEAVAFQRTGSPPDSWSTHVDGAAELIKLRGARQLNSALGRALFVDVSNNVYASCAQRRVSVPPAFAELRAHLCRISGQDSPEIGLGSVMDSMIGLLSEMTETGNGPQHVPAFIQRGLQLIAEIGCVMEQLAEISPYSVVPPPNPAVPTYNGVCHQYTGPRATRHWNILRLMRLFVNKWVHRAAMTLVDKAVARTPGGNNVDRKSIIESTKTESDQMAMEILSSVPFFGLLEAQYHSQHIMARWLIWPLSAVAVSTLISPSARIFARESLENLSKGGNLPQVIEAINMVDEHSRLEDW